MIFKVGDSVKVLDEDEIGQITEISSSGLVTVLIDDFEFDYKVSDIIRVGEGNEVQYQFQEPSFANYTVATTTESNNPKKLDVPIFNKISKSGIPELDLHIHELVENPKSLTNSEMLSTQSETLEWFIAECINKRVTEFVVIHGVGEGVLKHEVRSILESHGNIEFRDADHREYGSGATYARIRGLFQ